MICFSLLSQNNQITEVTLEHLSRLQQLETLNLQNNRLTTQGTADEGVSGGQRLKTAQNNLLQRVRMSEREREQDGGMQKGRVLKELLGLDRTLSCMCGQHACLKWKCFFFPINRQKRQIAFVESSSAAKNENPVVIYSL